MSNQTKPFTTMQRNTPNRSTPTDFNRIVEEIHRGGIHTVPAFLASRWGLVVGDAKHLIRKHQTI